MTYCRAPIEGVSVKMSNFQNPNVKMLKSQHQNFKSNVRMSNFQNHNVKMSKFKNPSVKISNPMSECQNFLRPLSNVKIWSIGALTVLDALKGMHEATKALTGRLWVQIPLLVTNGY